MSNKSMDVRAKQRLCYRTGLFNSKLRGGGFAPRHLNRSTASCEIYETSNSSFNLFRFGNLDCQVRTDAGGFEVAL